MTPPTWSNVAQVIADGTDDLHGIADELGLHAPDLAELLQEMVDKGLLYRWHDGTTRYGVCRERRSA